MDVKAVYRRFFRKYETMDAYEKMRFYVISGIGAAGVLLMIGLLLFFYLRYLNVIIGVDTTGLLGNPAVFIKNMSSGTIKDVSVTMDTTYTAHVDTIKPKESVVIYFISFRPLPPAGFKPREITVRSGFGVETKSFLSVP